LQAPWIQLKANPTMQQSFQVSLVGLDPPEIADFFFLRAEPSKHVRNEEILQLSEWEVQ
jgi:hypothetical protein